MDPYGVSLQGFPTHLAIPRAEEMVITGMQMPAPIFVAWKRKVAEVVYVPWAEDWQSDRW